ncbi:bifunctional 3-(3-hydroxy-phenyl)propionate/3-hydroxycinnamic acid hydroxylase [Pseudonocardia kujensis]|uniref:bifunctional 3-(3-hydroxy-phenyl)propionate/3-hydroxycinnamic acid hydroxylase n=1 Tax=Pseudonocardia kujensis TaxID=1128675 RepID=UPI001E56A978|nr:bifunctional 3-(3-hydroxy-phenyl)propionate/3-hydroxycinnamic acid hydroxylase [Pseudonocardia kujensis]MCE0763326.1 bifunctional 3-(3-hydroxy-phenyl)propionate/3-hydroxycinnamic acid hydroxylase [Pseudonocardia kujensis]
MSESVGVIVIGAGPSGLATAALLVGRGARVALVDPYRLAVHHPRATHVDDETVRIMQTLGAAHLEPQFLRHADGGYEIYDAHHRLVRYMPWRPEPTDQGWYGDYQFFQPDLENVLRGRLHASPHFASYLGWRATAIEQTDTQVTVTVRHDRTGEQRTLTARYLVGCDGARSTVRGLISPDVEDLRGTHRSLILDIAPFTTSPAVPVNDAFTKAIPPNPITCLPISHGMVRFEWLLNPRDVTEDFEQPARWYELLAPFYAPGDYRIARADVYRWESLLPTRWRRGNLFIAGDAAHQMPPHLGQGMGSGLRDAMNLAWKLDACLAGADESLLDTYQSEREPHVRVYVQAAVAAANGVEWMSENPGEPGDAPAVAEAAMPSPQLGPGVHGTTAGGSGALSPQPRLLGGERMDDVVGYRFAVIGDPTLLGAVDPATAAAWERIGASVIAETPPELRRWLDEHGADAAVIRPDRYVLGLASCADELDTLTARLVTVLDAPQRTPVNGRVSVTEGV